MTAFLPLFLLQDTPEVRVGERPIPVRVRAKNAERGPAAMDFGEVEPGSGILVAFPRDRYLHFYWWTRGRDAGRRKYDVAFITSKGEVVEVTALRAERMHESRPAYGINRIRGITSSHECRFALFVAPDTARDLGLREGASVEVRLGGVAIEPMPALELGDRKIHLEIVAFEPDRSRGLTYRPNFSRGDGMLFCWPDAKKRPIWMLRTLIPLDVTYIARDGTILEIFSLDRLRDPESEREAREKMSRPTREAHYILETPQGYMRESGFRVGDRLKLPAVLETIEPEKSPFE